MAIALWVGEKSFPLGSPSLFGALFSSMHVLLEKASWGTRFPALMNQLYTGRLRPEAISRARAELVEVRTELSRFSPDRLVWDHENPKTQPPWGAAIAPTITSLANYFWTSEGQPLLDVLETALLEAEASRLDVEIR